MISPSRWLVGRAARWPAPAGALAIAILLDCLWPAPVGPLFIYCAVFGWSIVWPDRLSPLGCFVAGLILDTVEGWPPGLSALMLLLLRQTALVSIGPVRNPSIVVIWKAFAVLLPPIMALRWMVASGWWGHAFAPAPFLFEFLASLMALPLVVALLVPLSRSRARTSYAP